MSKFLLQIYKLNKEYDSIFEHKSGIYTVIEVNEENKKKAIIIALYKYLNPKENIRIYNNDEIIHYNKYFAISGEGYFFQSIDNIIAPKYKEDNFIHMCGRNLIKQIKPLVENTNYTFDFTKWYQICLKYFDDPELYRSQMYSNFIIN